LILVDSSVWIDYLRGAGTRETDLLDGLLGTHLLATGDLMLAEVLQGFRSDSEFDQARRLFAGLDIVTLGGPEIAWQAARNVRALRARGITTRKTIDTIIATRCIADGHALLYSDRDFDPFVEHLGLRTAQALR
jgi:predicted nucleic acid-binding protein